MTVSGTLIRQMRCMTHFALIRAQVLMIDPNQTGCTASTILPTKSSKIRVTVDKTCCNQGLGYKVRQSECEEVFWPSRSREAFWTNACGRQRFLQQFVHRRPDHSQELRILQLLGCRAWPHDALVCKLFAYQNSHSLSLGGLWGFVASHLCVCLRAPTHL